MEMIVALSVVLIASVVFFVLCRELVLWYFKINDHITLQKQQLAMQTEIRDVLIHISRQIEACSAQPQNFQVE